MKTHYQILIVGGGNAGISVAAQLLRKQKNLDIAIVEPSEKHYYQPAWTLVGGGDFDIKKTERSEASVMPKGVAWIKDKIVRFSPESNEAHSATSGTFSYDYLVLCPGIQLDWHKVAGAREALGKNGITSNYLFETAPYTWEAAQNIKAGDTLLFTNPSTPIKCGGAPQKIMYLLADYLRKKDLLKKVSIHFYSGGGVIFGVEKYAATLNKVIQRYGIHTHFKHNLVAIDAAGKNASFVDDVGNMVKHNFDFIHITPPQSAPDFIKSSPFAIPDTGADANNPCLGQYSPNFLGWIDVNKHTLQHNKFPNVFACGDAANTPNAKTGAAIRKQAPVLVRNLLAMLRKEALQASYNGYGSCPLVTGYGKLVLAEFDYNNQPIETFPFDQSQERWSMYQLKKQVLPWLYWNKILKGTA